MHTVLCEDCQVYQNAQGKCSTAKVPVLVEYSIRHNAGMLLEDLRHFLSKPVDGTLLLSPLPSLLPNSIFIVQVLQKPN